jgi:putative membrane protein
MTTRKAHKITGILAAALAASALGTLPLAASAQTATNSLPPSQQPVPTLPQTTPPDTSKAPDRVQAPPAVGDTSATASAAATSGPAAKDFMRQAYLSNEFAIAAAQIALKTSENADVKAAAQSILTDGLKVRQDMVTAIQGATTDMHFDQNWDDDYKQKLADLKSTAGKDFDQKYLATQGEITKSVTGAYSGYANAGTDAPVKSFAQSTLPRLQADWAKLDKASSSVAAEPDRPAAATPIASKATKATKHTKTR